MVIPNGVGVIDNNYTGNIMVPVVKVSHGLTFVEKGERIAQLMLFPQVKIEVLDGAVEDTAERGRDGFGSSGKD